MKGTKPPTHLRNAILLEIAREECRRARLYLCVASTTLLFSVIGIILSVRYSLLELSHSSFSSYFSLLFSDSDIVLTYWKELTWSLIETIPFVGIIVALVCVGMLLVSVRALANNLRGLRRVSFGI